MFFLPHMKSISFPFKCNSNSFTLSFHPLKILGFWHQLYFWPHVIWKFYKISILILCYLLIKTVHMICKIYHNNIEITAHETSIRTFLQFNVNLLALFQSNWKTHPVFFFTLSQERSWEVLPKLSKNQVTWVYYILWSNGLVPLAKTWLLEYRRSWFFTKSYGELK
jgi:hypothetical protein